MVILVDPKFIVYKGTWRRDLALKGENLLGEIERKESDQSIPQ